MKMIVMLMAGMFGLFNFKIILKSVVLDVKHHEIAFVLNWCHISKNYLDHSSNSNYTSKVTVTVTTTVMVTVNMAVTVIPAVTVTAEVTVTGAVTVSVAVTVGVTVILAVTLAVHCLLAFIHGHTERHLLVTTDPAPSD